jgi:hypothetical protein
LKLNYGDWLSSYAFNISLRRYVKVRSASCGKQGVVAYYD